MDQALLIVLLLVVVGQQIFFMHQTNKMVNKIMSRNYGEYKTAEEFKVQETRPRIPLEPREDLRPLDELMV